MLHRLGVVFLIAIALMGCQGRRDAADLPPSTPGLELQTEDFTKARSGFKTKLVMHRPSPQAGEPLRTPPGAAEIGYARLKAYVTPDPGDRRKHPAVLFLHGGFAFGQGQWETAQPFRDAGDAGRDGLAPVPGGGLDVGLAGPRELPPCAGPERTGPLRHERYPRVSAPFAGRLRGQLQVSDPALAKHAGLDVEVPGDHFSSVPEAIRLSTDFFRRR